LSGRAKSGAPPSRSDIHSGDMTYTLHAFFRQLLCRPYLANIEALGESLLEFRSRADLTRWLRENAS
jgi:hypothetical protein